jgi:glutathione S-transferase
MGSNSHKITVWGRRNSMNVQKVMWTLGELGLDYQRNDMAGSFGIDDQYTAKNPNAVVPTIEDGELTLYESNACVRYLARQYGGGSLCPPGLKEAAIADQWMDWQCSTFGTGFFMIFMNKIRVSAEKSSQDQITKGEKQTAHLLQQLETKLERADFLVGHTLTMADIPIGAMLYRYFVMEIERPSLPAVEAYYQRLTDRPAYQKQVMIPFGRNSDEWLSEEKRNARLQ